MAAATAIITIALVRETAITASVPSIAASMAAVTRVLSEGLLVTSVTRATVVALGLPCFGKTM